MAELHSVLHVFPEQWKTIPYVNEDINLPMLGKQRHTCKNYVPLANYKHCDALMLVNGVLKEIFLVIAYKYYYAEKVGKHL